MTIVFPHCEREVKIVLLSLPWNKLVDGRFGKLLPKWDQRKRLSYKTILVSEFGWVKWRVIITLHCDRIWLNKMKGYHNHSLWENLSEQNEKSNLVFLKAWCWFFFMKKTSGFFGFFTSNEDQNEKTKNYFTLQKSFCFSYFSLCNF